MEKRITVTQNVSYSLEILEKAVKGLPEGETKEKAKGAINYLLKAAAGEKQPNRGQECIKPIRVWP
jgi:hypothetical protein